jgi:hypothetical protein
VLAAAFPSGCTPAAQWSCHLTSNERLRPALRPPLIPPTRGGLAALALCSASGLLAAQPTLFSLKPLSFLFAPHRLMPCVSCQRLQHLISQHLRGRPGLARQTPWRPLAARPPDMPRVSSPLAAHAAAPSLSRCRTPRNAMRRPALLGVCLPPCNIPGATLTAARQRLVRCAACPCALCHGHMQPLPVTSTSGCRWGSATTCAHAGSFLRVTKLAAGPGGDQSQSLTVTFGQPTDGPAPTAVDAAPLHCWTQPVPHLAASAGASQQKTSTGCEQQRPRRCGARASPC